MLKAINKFLSLFNLVILTDESYKEYTQLSVKIGQLVIQANNILNKLKGI